MPNPTSSRSGTESAFGRSGAALPFVTMPSTGILGSRRINFRESAALDEATTACPLHRCNFPVDLWSRHRASASRLCASTSTCKHARTHECKQSCVLFKSASRVSQSGRSRLRCELAKLRQLRNSLDEYDALVGQAVARKKRGQLQSSCHATLHFVQILL